MKRFLVLMFLFCFCFTGILPGDCQEIDKQKVFAVATMLIQKRFDDKLFYNSSWFIDKLGIPVNPDSRHIDLDDFMAFLYGCYGDNLGVEYNTIAKAFGRYTANCVEYILKNYEAWKKYREGVLK